MSLGIPQPMPVNLDWTNQEAVVRYAIGILIVLILTSLIHLGSIFIVLNGWLLTSDPRWRL